MSKRQGRGSKKTRKSGPRAKKNKIKGKRKRYAYEYSDDPVLRHVQNKSDISSINSDEKPGNLRIIALDRAVGKDFSVGTPPIPGASNWIQMGPTAIPEGSTISYYYYWYSPNPEMFKDPLYQALVTGRITAIVIDPNNSDIIYAGAAQGGIWKTEDGGRNWSAKSDYEISLAIGALAIDPKNTQVLYAGTGEGNYSADSYYGNGILKTTDGGKTWKNYGLKEFSLARFSRIVINPEKTEIIFAAITSSEDPDIAAGIYRSLDGGKNWTIMKGNLPSTNTNGATDIALDPSNPDIAYAAFYGDGIYKTEEATKDYPLWRKLTIKDLEPNSFSRIALGISPSSPRHIYALIASKERPFDSKYEKPDPATGPQPQRRIIDHFHRSEDGGDSWTRIPLPGSGTKFGPWVKDSIGGQGTYNIHVAVNPNTPDIVYLCGVSLWKAILDRSKGKWFFEDIGKSIHPDNHALIFDPNNPSVIYAGNDGGIYRSKDGGRSWDDTINEGLCITQFEFMALHPKSDALVLAGTQDNGTLQFRNNSAFYYSAGGDGGFVAIDPINPNHFWRQYVRTTLFHSARSGQRPSWSEIDKGIKGNPCLFYAPFTLDQSDPKNIAFGSNKIFLDKDRGHDGWRAAGSSPIELRGLLTKEETDALGLAQQELVSAINYLNFEPGLIYAGTNYGKICRITKIDGKWRANIIHDFLASEVKINSECKVWDIATYPDDMNTIIVVLAGFGSKERPRSHVWRGIIPKSNVAPTEWTDISPRSDQGEIIDIPVNALVIDDQKPNTMYIGTDIGVFRTSDSGRSWTKFSEGLPNCAVFDMRLYRDNHYEDQNSKRLLRVVTHGRGMWERRLDVDNMPDVDVFVRDHLMDTGRFTPSLPSIKAAFDDPLQHEDPNRSVILEGELKWSMCADIKVDSPSPSSSSPTYQFDDMESVDYVKFESKLVHRSVKRERVNHIYVQIHNRGIISAGQDPSDKVQIKLLHANIVNGDSQYPKLPSNFWLGFIDNSFDTSAWKPIGEVKYLPTGVKTLTSTEPTVIGWEWNVPPETTDRVCLLVVINSPQDPVPDNNKEIVDVENLVRSEKHIGLREVQVVDA